MPQNFDLRRDRHAIGQFDASLTFAGNVSASQFTHVLEGLNDAAGALQLPAPMNVQVFNIAIGNPSAPPLPDGKGFQRYSPNGEIEESLFCETNEIRYTLRDYVNWDTTRTRLSDAFSILLEKYKKFIPAISSIRIQYLNEFRAREGSTSSCGEIFRSDSKWIAPHLIQSDESWHCHTGQFISTDEDFRHLVNVNCDVAPAPWPPTDETRNFAKVLIMAANQYDIPGIGPLILKDFDPKSLLLQNLDQAHSLEKRILNELIADEYIALMGEGANEY